MRSSDFNILVFAPILIAIISCLGIYSSPDNKLKFVVAVIVFSALTVYDTSRALSYMESLENDNKR